VAPSFPEGLTRSPLNVAVRKAKMGWFTKATVEAPVDTVPVYSSLIEVSKAAICPNDHIFVPFRSEFSPHGCPCGEREFVMLARTSLVKNVKRAKAIKPVSFHEFLRKRVEQ
jgi:hypothetical protein